jgi:hypothetical protein
LRPRLGFPARVSIGRFRARNGAGRRGAGRVPR